MKKLIILLLFFFACTDTDEFYWDCYAFNNNDENLFGVGQECFTKDCVDNFLEITKKKYTNCSCVLNNR